MRKQTLYSSSSRAGRPAGESAARTPGSIDSGPTQAVAAPGSPTPPGGSRPRAAVRLSGPAARASAPAGSEAARRHAGAAPGPAEARRPAGSGANGGGTNGNGAPARRPGRFSPRRIPAVAWFGAVAFTALGISVHGALQPTPRKLTQADIDRAVLHTLEKSTLPSAARKAYDVIRPSVVRVQGTARRAKNASREDTPMSTGTGVIVVESGLILTNLHVVDGSSEIQVTFADGSVSPATVISTQPQNDLAVLQPRTLPDDVVPATLRGTADLAPGDTVVAVGFPFGIGPSVSAGVVSGLKREYEASNGKTTLTNLIQFDAAANPGSSGGPLVTAEGEVVGIVTAILNPSDQRVFIGIGFAVPIENAAGGMGLPPH